MQRKLVSIVLLMLLCVGILVVSLKVSPVSAAPVVDGVITAGEYDGGMAVQLTGQWNTSWTVDAYIWWDTQYLYVAVNEPVPATTGKVSWIEFCMDAGPSRPNLDAFVLFDDGTLQYVTYTKPSGGWGWAPAPFPWLAVNNTATEFQIKYTDYGIAFNDTIKLVLDRNLGPPPPSPLGQSAYWPGHEEIVYPTPNVTKWGDVTLDHGLGHVVDGVINPGEYDGGMAVQLVGRTDPNWTVDAYIAWDNEYLYVAVNEPVPNTTGHKSWIEFAIDAGPARPYLDAFILFDDNAKWYDRYVKPSGIWVGVGPGNFSAVSDVATEFKVKYTDYQIVRGGTLKMSIDRNLGPAPPPPWGFAAFLPQNATVYDGTPIQAVPTTWGDVYLSFPPGHNVNGLISPGEYDGGMAVQLVGRTDPNWTVDGFIDWDNEYLYVAVNEPVPNTTGHISWIEFAIDAGPARSYLDAFVLFDDHIQSHVRYPKPSGPWSGQGPSNFTTVSNVATEFKLKYTDYGIVRGDTIKLSIDRNLGPAPPAPYGFAAFWPQNATVYYGTPPAQPETWGDVHLTRHNIAVTDITPFKTVIGLGYSGNLSMTTGNPGDYIENIDTTAYVNHTTVATFVNTTLTGGDSTTLIFTWDTTGASYGMYELSAVADPVPDETNLADNNYTCPVLVHVGVPGDVSGPTQGVFDGTTNMRDVNYIILLFNTNPSSSNWKPNADVNNDGIVNMRDIQIAILNFNKHE